MNKRLIVAAFCCICLLFQISCKTKRIADTPAVDQSRPEDVVKLMRKNQFRFTTLSLKFNADAQTGEGSSTFSGNIYMVKDSMIWVSIQKLGLEAFRFLVTNDSVKILDRINKVYIAGGHEMLDNMLKMKFDFALFQAIITGNDNEKFTTAGFAEKQEEDYIILNYSGIKMQSAGQDTLFSQEIWLLKGIYKIGKNIFTEHSGNIARTAGFDYSGFQDFGEQKFPQRIDFRISDSGSITGSIIYTRISPEKKENAPFSVPAGYGQKN